jgi:hypothetical protein
MLPLTFSACPKGPNPSHKSFFGQWRNKLRTTPDYFAEALRRLYEHNPYLIRQAAEPSVPEAQLYLGLMYYQGWGVPRDRAKAARFFANPAQLNYPQAAELLGYVYQEGDGGLPQSDEAALEWYLTAANAGDPVAMPKPTICWKISTRTMKRSAGGERPRNWIFPMRKSISASHIWRARAA